MKDSPFIHVLSQSPSSPTPQRSVKEHEQRAYSVPRECKKKCVCMCASESTLKLKQRESLCMHLVEWPCVLVSFCPRPCVSYVASPPSTEGEYPPDIMPLFSAKLCSAQRSRFMLGSSETCTSEKWDWVGNGLHCDGFAWGLSVLGLTHGNQVLL